VPDRRSRQEIYGFIGERGVRLIFQADAVRVGSTQFRA